MQPRGCSGNCSLEAWCQSCPSRRALRYVLLADRLDWPELERIAQTIRTKKNKNGAGRPSHLRALVGAVVLMGLRRLPYRGVEDQAKHYAPARYLMGLTETQWTPDFRTVNDFTKLMGEDGIKALNQEVVELAVQEGRADPSEVSGDTTAQEAAVPLPNEMGLMAQFFSTLKKAVKRAGSVMKKTFTKMAPLFEAAHERLRSYRFFTETKAQRITHLEQMMALVTKAQSRLAAGLRVAAVAKRRFKGRAKTAMAKAQRVHDNMKALLPQIAYWVKTGFVAMGKIISVHLPELYSVVRGKVGKPVEFGINWGMTRVRGGCLMATMAKVRNELGDQRFVGRAVDDHIAIFGKLKSFAYDRGGYSKANVRLLKAKGVKNVGLAPRGQTQWEVGPQMKRRLMNERAKIEGCIGL